jgi:hypothetical protein
MLGLGITHLLIGASGLALLSGGPVDDPQVILYLRAIIAGLYFFRQLLPAKNPPDD